MELNPDDRIRNGMDFVVGNMEQLRAMVVRICLAYHRADLSDEMFCDAIVGNADRAFNKFNQERNDDLPGWMFAQFQFYCRKWFAKYSKRASRESQIDDDTINILQQIADDSDGISALTNRQEVIGLLDQLGEYERRLVRLHYGFDNSFEEIANKIGGAPSTLRIHCNQAVRTLQRLLRERGGK